MTDTETAQVAATSEQIGELVKHSEVSVITSRIIRHAEVHGDKRPMNIPHVPAEIEWSAVDAAKHRISIPIRHEDKS